MLTEEAPDTISLRQILDIIRVHFVEAFLIIFTVTSIAFLLAVNLPQKFKSKAVLSIQSSYFQHPLVSDLLSEVHDPSELNSQRLSLLRLALNEKFLDELAAKYDIYAPSNIDATTLVLEREKFLKKIEYFSVSPTSFQISIIAPNPKAAFLLTNDVLAQMTFTLIEQRYQSLMQARQAIVKQATLLNRTLLTNFSTPQQQTLRSQLATMEANLAALRSRYTEKHPGILQLKQRSQALRTRIEQLPQAAQKTEDDYMNVFISPASQAPSQEIFNDLLKKLSHLNIVLEMERDRQNVSYLAVIEQPAVPTRAFSPDRIQFVLIGALCGLLLAGVRVAYLELQRDVKLTPPQVSTAFGLELLGELPPFDQEDYILMLEGPNGGVTSLPPPGAAR